MKKIILLVFLILSITILSSCEEEIIMKKYYKTAIIQTGSINTISSYSSFTEGITETLLSSKTGGRIISMSKNKGDRVKLKENLAILDSDEAQIGVDTSTNIINSLNKLKISVSETYDSQIKAMEKSLNKSEQTLKGIKTSKENTENINASDIFISENKLQETKLNLKLINKNLDETKGVLELQKNQIFKNAKNSITSALILDTNIINFIDEFLGITYENKNKNDNFDQYLSAKNSKYLKEATIFFNETNKSYKEYKNYYETFIEDKDATNEQIIEGLRKGKDLAEDIKKLLNSTNDVILNSVDNIFLTKTELNNYSSNIYDLGNSIESSIITIVGEYPIGLKGSLDSIDSIEKNIDKQIVLLKGQVSLNEKQVDIAKTNLERIKNINTSNIDIINTNKKIGNINISEIKANIESLKKEKISKLQEINTSIQEALGNKNIGNIMIGNSKILSTFAGIITEKYGEIGQVIEGGIPVYKLVDDSKIKIKVHVNNFTVNNIHLFDQISIKIEGIKNNFVGKVTNIPNTQDKISKNTEIEITINNPKQEIIVGSIAKVFIKNTSETGIIIPNKAIISDFMIPSVITVTNNIAHLKNISIITENDDYSLVKGIEVGEIIIIEGQENIWDGEELN